MDSILHKLKAKGYPETETGETSVTSYDEDEFDAMLAEECSQARTTFETSQLDLKLKLLQLANSKTRLPINTDTIQYWQAKRYEDPELYDLAMTALAAPATQVSVERCFSAVKILLDERRLRMSADLLNDLMIIRCNQDLLPLAVSKIRNENN